MRLSLSGAPGVGKTSLSELLVQRQGFRRLSFAAALKAELAEILGCEAGLFDREKGHWRKVLQVWGTEARRKLDPDYWCNLIAFQVQCLEMEGEAENLVVDDARFLNEVELLRTLGFQLIRLDCPKAETIDF